MSVTRDDLTRDDIPLAALVDDEGDWGLRGGRAHVASSAPEADRCSEVLTARGRRNRTRWLVVLGAVYVISWVVPRSELPIVPVCPLHNVLGWSCPTCGLTRGFVEIGHGNFAAATSLNVLALPVYALGLAMVALLGWELTTGRSVVVPFARRRQALLLALLATAIAVRYFVLL